MRDEVDKLLREAAARVLREHAPEALELVASLSVVPPKTAEHGDFASNAALVLAKALRRPPRQVAELLQQALGNGGGALERSEIAGPGFLNVFLARSRWRDAIVRVLQEGAGFGRTSSGAGAAVMVEFVSANPTGPLTIGHGRNAVLGEPAELPDEGYQGEYLVEIARALAAEVGASWRDGDEARFKARATDAIFADIERTLVDLGVRFDSHFNEHTLFERKLVDRTLDDLRARGLVFEEEGAVWLRSTGFGLERDRVLIKKTGEATYLLPDIAYHRESLARGLSRIIDVLGPDHIAQFPYVRAAVSALGGDAERIELVMYQWVNLRRGGELVKMSTRKASFVTVDDVLAEVGRDVFRYFMVERRADSHLDFDVELAVERSERNPVFKIQYAHARLCSIARKADEAGLGLGDDPRALALGRIDAPEEIELAKLVERLPDVVQHAAQAREPQELARYLLELANAFNGYISDGKRHRVVSDDHELSLARLALVSAVRTALANGLALLGVAAPERM